MKLRVVEGRHRRVVGHIAARHGMIARDGFGRRLTVRINKGVHFVYDCGRTAPISHPPAVERHVAEQYETFKGV